MKRLKVVSSLLMIVLSPILLGGCDITFGADKCPKGGDWTPSGCAQDLNAYKNVK